MLAVSDPLCGVRVFLSGDATSANATSLYRIGSVTKTFTSAVILSLEKDGTLALTDPLSKWIADVPNTDGVTIRMLLNHTSGIVSYTDFPTFWMDRKKKWAPRELVDLATSIAPYFAPGADFHYSNTNYILLGMIAEKAGSARIGALVRSRALTKAGLSDTFFDGEETVGGTLAKGVTGTTDVTFVADPSGPWTAGAIVASGADLVRWVSVLYGSEAVLDSRQKAELVASPVSDGGYGLGVAILAPSVTLGGGRALGHNGAIDGFRTQAFWFEDKKTGVAAVVNSDSADPNEISLAAIKVLFK